jgi:hypothetical protein
MAKVPLTSTDLQDHLREQISFLQTSCESYDNGFDGEAKRIAVVLRVLLHESRSSHSLLGQLNKKNTQFLSSSLPHEETSLSIHGGLVMVAAKGKESKFVALLDDVPFLRWCSFDDWWKEAVFVDDQKNILTREQLILTASNQDGGAHVDPALENTYFRLTKQNSLGISYNEGDLSIPIPKPERAALRQIAHEVLKTLIPDYQKKPMPDNADIYFGGATLVQGAAAPPLPGKQKIQRNDPCPCGSGKKFKHCHGKYRM